MVVVVIVAILAAIVVPIFTSEAKKVKANSEVSAMIAELSTKQERHKSENGSYLDVANCFGSISATAQDVTPCYSNADWTALGIVAPETKLRCNYEVVTGDSVTAPTTSAFTGATYTVPTGCCATSWYMIHATCDMDGNGTYSHYVSQSFDAHTQVTNEGQ